MRKLYSLILWAACMLSLPAFAQKDRLQIPFGKSGLINIDLKRGVIDVKQDGRQIIWDAKAEVHIGDRPIASTDYHNATYTKTAISTGFGKGDRYLVRFTKDDLPEMDLIFYTYPGRDYFLTEVEMQGASLSSNYMSPLAGKLLPISGDARTLFVPFDNDTFISYNAKPYTGDMLNISAEVGAMYDNTSRNGLVMGSVEHTVWKTGVVSVRKADTNYVQAFGGYTQSDVTRDNITHGSISGRVIKSPLMFVGYFNDWRDGLEEYGKANRIAEPPYVFNWTKPTPVGWNSWGVLQEKLTYEKAIKVADFFADSLAGFREGNTAFIDLDSYWDNMVRGGLNGDLSQLKKFVAHCQQKGLEPGVYWAPFTDWGWKGGPDRTAEGSDYKFGDMWTKVLAGYHDIDGARALDPTHPGTRARIAFVIGKLKECGFRMIKIDFLGHATVESTHFYDPTVTTGMQAYRKGMEYLIDQLGNQMLLYAAISPNLATGRYVHMRRIACDAFKSINDTRYTLNSVNYGWWQTYVYNYIDADHVVLATQSEGENRARMLSAIITGTWMTGDDFSKPGPWSAFARKWYQDKDLLQIVKNGKAFRPVEGNSGTVTNPIFVRTIDGYCYVAVFNFSDKAADFTIDAARVGLPSGKSFNGMDLSRKQPISLNGKAVVNLGAADAALYRFKVE